MGVCESDRDPEFGDGTSFQRGEQYFALTADINPTRNPRANTHFLTGTNYQIIVEIKFIYIFP